MSGTQCETIDCNATATETNVYGFPGTEPRDLCDEHAQDVRGALASYEADHAARYGKNASPWS